MDNLAYTTRETCRLCYSNRLEFLFSLGDQYVSNFTSKEDIYSGPKCPIELVQCRNCTLVQLKHTAPQELLYKRTYWYRSGVTATMREALLDVVKAANKRVHLHNGDVVLDIGSNDGTLLRHWKDVHDGVITVGVEPAENLMFEGKKGVDVFIGNFWEGDYYRGFMGRLIDDDAIPTEDCRPKVVTAIGMFYDLEDPNPFIADIAQVLHPEGVFVAQLMCAKNMLAVGDIGNLCHEHLEYYTLASLSYLFDKHGLKIVDIETNKVNGESYRLYIRHKGYPQAYSDAVEQAFLAELDMKLNEPAPYRAFYERIEGIKKQIILFLNYANSVLGKKVWVYGASTKGNVILQWLGLNHEVIEAAAERSPEKVGKYTVGTGIPIRSEIAFREANPAYALVLPYAFRNEFIEREREWLEQGGKFIFPLPFFEVVGKETLNV